MTEQQIQQAIRLRLGRGESRIWRNNVGTGWAGPATRVDATNLAAMRGALRPGDVVVRNGRPLHAGLEKGSGDLIGVRSITVAPEHVGRVLGVFTSVEVKTPTGRVRPEQAQWVKVIEGLGGLAGVARSVEDAAGIIEPEWLSQR